MRNAAVKNDDQEQWQYLPIKEFAHTTSGGTPKRGVAEYYNGSIPWIKSGDLNDGYLNCCDEFITELGLKESSAKLFKPGTILIALYGATIGRLSILNFEAATNQAVCGITVSENVDVKYLFYFLLSIRQKLIDQGKGGAQPNINQQIVKETVVPLAPLGQQKLIVAKIEELFSHVDAGIAALQSAKKLLKQYRQSVLTAAVTGELTKDWREANKDKLNPISQLLECISAERESEYIRKIDGWEKELVEWRTHGSKGKKPAKPQRAKLINGMLNGNISTVSSLPYGWLWIGLECLSVDVFDGPFGSNLKSNDYVQDGIRVIRLENIGSLEFKNDKTTFVTNEKYTLLKKHSVSGGDIIFSSFVIDSTRVVVLPSVIDKAINKADCFCVRTYGESINAYYLALFLSSTHAYKKLENQVHGATRPRINTTQLKELEIPLCSNAEQMEIVRLTEEKFESIARLESNIKMQLLKIDRHKQSILASAFQGKITKG